MKSTETIFSAKTMEKILSEAEVPKWAMHTNDYGISVNKDGWYFVANPMKINMPNIEKVIFNPPATIMFFEDKTKVVVKCMDGEEYNPEVGMAMCIAKKVLGEKYHKTFRDFVKEWEEKEGIVGEISLEELKCFGEIIKDFQQQGARMTQKKTSKEIIEEVESLIGRKLRYFERELIERFVDPDEAVKKTNRERSKDET